ncbi:unnamed protein product [Arabidopsis halleri]
MEITIMLWILHFILFVNSHESWSNDILQYKHKL